MWKSTQAHGRQCLLPSRSSRSSIISTYSTCGNLGARVISSSNETLLPSTILTSWTPGSSPTSGMMRTTTAMWTTTPTVVCQDFSLSTTTGLHKLQPAILLLLLPLLQPLRPPLRPTRTSCLSTCRTTPSTAARGVSTSASKATRRSPRGS